MHKLGIRLATVLLVFVLLLFIAPFFAPEARAFGLEDLHIPSDAEAVAYGSSGEGRTLTAYRFGDGENVMVLGFAIHGYEDNWQRDGEALVYTAGELMKLLQENLSLLDEYGWSVYVLPCMNPDGLENGYTNNGPGRCTTYYYDADGVLVQGGLDLNRCFPFRWTQHTDSRLFNGSQPLAAKEAQALAKFIQDVRGPGENVLLDVHGWESSVLAMDDNSTAARVLKQAFPENRLVTDAVATGYFFSYARELGYDACLFEFPDGSHSLEAFINSEACQRFNSCIPQLLKSFVNDGPRVTVRLEAEGPGTVRGAGDYLPGSTLTVSARADDGAYFAGWYERDTLVSDEPEYQLSVFEDYALTARFSKLVNVSVTASRSGTVSGGGAFLPGEQVTLTALPNEEGLAAKWYRGDECVSEEPVYTFLAQQDEQLYLLFADDVFVDIPPDAWYLSAVTEAYSRGLTNGVSAVRFGPSAFYSRAMAAVMLFRLEGADAGAAPTFEDVPQDRYYTAAVGWAQENGIVNGTSEARFSPDIPVTREQFITMLVRYLHWKGFSAEPAELAYTDRAEIHEYAKEAIAEAQSMGLIQGYENGEIRPREVLTRSEGTVLILRAVYFTEGTESAGSR